MFSCSSQLIQIMKCDYTTKLPNSEESYKGKVKTHKYINTQNQSTTENCENRNDPDLVQAFLKKWSITDTLRLILAYCRHTFLRHRKPYLCSMLCIFPKTYKYECDCGIFYILSYIGLMMCFSLQS